MAYIDKELLLKDIYKNIRFSLKSGVISPELRGARKVIDRIENAPTADVVEVVRCKDCVHWDPIGFAENGGWCEKKNIAALHNGFCESGERKDA